MRWSVMAIDIATATSIPLTTPRIMTPRAATTARYWSLFNRHKRTSGLGSSECNSAEITTAPTTGSGTRAICSPATAIATTMTMAAHSPASRVAAPAASFAEEAENPAPTGMPRMSPDAMFIASFRCHATIRRPSAAHRLWQAVRMARS
jgi:hypothetical protein